MADIAHGKYVVTQPKQNLVVPGWAGNLQEDTSTRVRYVDSEVIKGASSMWSASGSGRPTNRTKQVLLPTLMITTRSLASSVPTRMTCVTSVPK
jgi:hypothetical protein